MQLDSRIKQEIVHELHSVSRVREALDVVDIVMGFLSSGGGKSDRQLGDYITRTLWMSKKKRFSEKVIEFALPQLNNQATIPVSFHIGLLC